MNKRKKLVLILLAVMILVAAGIPLFSHVSSEISRRDPKNRLDLQFYGAVVTGDGEVLQKGPIVFSGYFSEGDDFIPEDVQIPGLAGILWRPDKTKKDPFTYTDITHLRGESTQIIYGFLKPVSDFETFGFYYDREDLTWCFVDPLDRDFFIVGSLEEDFDPNPILDKFEYKTKPAT